MVRNQLDVHSHYLAINFILKCHLLKWVYETFALTFGWRKQETDGNDQKQEPLLIPIPGSHLNDLKEIKTFKSRLVVQGDVYAPAALSALCPWGRGNLADGILVGGKLVAEKMLLEKIY